MERDMTTGKPAKILLNFTIPIFIGNVFQQFYSMADTVIVGKFVGNTALAAVGACGTLTFLILGFLMGMTAGFTVVTAQHYGAGNKKAMRQSVACASILSLIVSVILTVLSMTLMKNVLHWMNTPADMYDQAYAYIMVICGGIVAQVLYNLLAGILRAIGDSKRPLYFLILAALLNIVLDLVFIIVFHMGAAGAAYATVISQGVSGLLCLCYIVKYVPELHLAREDWRGDWNLMKWQMKIGFPMAFQFSITAIGTIVVQTALNVFGSVAVAGYSAAAKIEQIVTQAYIALGTAMSTYCAQNMGAGKIFRIRQGFRSATWMGGIYAVLTGLVVFFWGKSVTVLFVSENVREITEYVDISLRCTAASFVFLAVVSIYRNGIQGMGFGLLPMTAGIAELAGRSIAALAASQFGSFLGICLASPAAWVLAAGLLLGMYFRIMHQYKRKGMMKEEPEEMVPVLKKGYT
ncbi:MATE family efflux transporter [Lachnospiraceae bacterium WCA-9-b2]|uniref:MATE family efflux transporter n=1 Tax=Sporofaciens musculi TaxID=2681861 RepID=A0A7X3MHE8_9FIRM|nr:MATE family efflux transporter [Sporofaciens musculi]MXP76473.1 MATE family efflux transporter [Sporofaciens musculi]